MPTKVELQARIDQLESERAEVIAILAEAMKPHIPMTRKLYLRDAMWKMGVKLVDTVWGWQVVEQQQEPEKKY